jgi:hypothetical protein
MAGSGASPLDQPDDVAGRIVLLIDASLLPAAREACDEAAAVLARRTGMPVTLAAVPIETVDAVQPLIRRAPGQLREHTPPESVASGSMGSAPFIWRPDGRPDWGAMWTAFCDLALYGGPPHRGADRALRGPEGTGRLASPDILAELQRGIRETTGLEVETAEHGWLIIACESPRMAAWLCAAIIVENVDARVEGSRLLLPAGPDFLLEDQVKSVITVMAKTHHYWREHLEPERRP